MDRINLLRLRVRRQNLASLGALSSPKPRSVQCHFYRPYLWKAKFDDDAGVPQNGSFHREILENQMGKSKSQSEHLQPLQPKKSILPLSGHRTGIFAGQ